MKLIVQIIAGLTALGAITCYTLRSFSTGLQHHQFNEAGGVLLAALGLCIFYLVFFAED